MIVRFETENGEASYARPEEAHRSNEGKAHIWIRTKNGEIKRADMV